MPSSQVPLLGSLQRPEKLSKALKEDMGDDCLSCRIVGMYKSHVSLRVNPALRVLMR